jgi:hypothetical protein
MECDILWRELVNRTARQHTIDIIKALGPWSRELRPVSVLTANETPIQDVPYYFDISSWWTKGIPDVDSIQCTLAGALRRSLGSGDAQYLLAQMRSSSTHTPQQVVRYLNLKTPRNMLQNFGFQIPSWIRLKTNECLWNVTPRYSFTDLHTDRGLDTVAFQVGGRKIWLLYEPEPPITAESKVRQSAYFEAWALRFQDASSGGLSNPASFLEQLGPSMRRPYIAVTEGQQALFIPAGWKHAVFTLQTGYLGGYSFSTHEHVQWHVNTLLCELHAAMRLVDTGKYKASTDYLNPELWADLESSLAYVMEHLHEVLTNPLPHTESGVAELWRRLHSVIQSSTPAMTRKYGRIIHECNKVVGANRTA